MIHSGQCPMGGVGESLKHKVALPPSEPVFSVYVYKYIFVCECACVCACVRACLCLCVNIYTWTISTVSTKPYQARKTMRYRPSSPVALKKTPHRDFPASEFNVSFSRTAGLKVALLARARRVRMTSASATRPLLNSQRGDSGISLEITNVRECDSGISLEITNVRECDSGI